MQPLSNFSSSVFSSFKERTPTELVQRNFLDSTITLRDCINNTNQVTWQAMVKVIQLGDSKRMISDIFKKAFECGDQIELNGMIRQAMKREGCSDVESFYNRLNVRENLEAAGIRCSFQNGLIEMGAMGSDQERDQLIDSALAKLSIPEDITRLIGQYAQEFESLTFSLRSADKGPYRAYREHSELIVMPFLKKCYEEGQITADQLGKLTWDHLDVLADVLVKPQLQESLKKQFGDELGHVLLDLSTMSLKFLSGLDQECCPALAKGEITLTHINKVGQLMRFSTNGKPGKLAPHLFSVVELEGWIKERESEEAL